MIFKRHFYVNVMIVWHVIKKQLSRMNYSGSVEGFDLFLPVLLNFQESVTSPAAQQRADGDKAGDQRRLDTDTTATTQNLEKRHAAQSKETGVVFSALHLYCLL